VMPSPSLFTVGQTWSVRDHRCLKKHWSGLHPDIAHLLMEVNCCRCLVHRLSRRGNGICRFCQSPPKPGKPKYCSGEVHPSKLKAGPKKTSGLENYPDVSKVEVGPLMCSLLPAVLLQLRVLCPSGFTTGNFEAVQALLLSRRCPTKSARAATFEAVSITVYCWAELEHASPSLPEDVLVRVLTSCCLAGYFSHMIACLFPYGNYCVPCCFAGKFVCSLARCWCGIYGWLHSQQLPKLLQQ
jgi:hypothetical protein